MSTDTVERKMPHLPRDLNGIGHLRGAHTLSVSYVYAERTDQWVATGWTTSYRPPIDLVREAEHRGWEITSDTAGWVLETGHQLLTIGRCDRCGR